MVEKLKNRKNFAEGFTGNNLNLIKVKGEGEQDLL